MDDTLDLLQIKINQAKAKLPPETTNAIDAVDWRAVILGLRTKRGYTFEQLGDLEIETELLLCGLLSPVEYPKKIESKLNISKVEAGEIVNEMNVSVFNRIKEELIKNIENKKISQNKATGNMDKIEPLNREDLLAKIENPDKVHPILHQKLNEISQIPSVKTEHTLENITKTTTPNGVDTKPKIPNVDPYREIPE